MASEHTVAQGEHLSRIAKNYGFSDYRTIWDHPKNAALKQKRRSPNVLNPGDRLHIPDREVREESRPTDQRHRFKVTGSRLMLRLVLENMYERPIANAPCELFLEGEKHQLTTDGQGKLEVAILPTAENGMLVLKTSATAIEEVAIPVKIGHLDPVEEVTGQKARLTNLGYYEGAIDDTEDDGFRMAVEEFQCEHALAVDGKCGPATQAKLMSAHGA
jgi:Putative peptidoglycan binding domain/LysM domain